MLPNATTSAFRSTLNEGEHLTSRRIRHITGIQIRNLTPFPVRDAFTSALDQPVDTGDIIDDLGAPLANVRSRRISTASNATRRGLKREDSVVEQDIIVPSEVRGRRPSTSRVTFTKTSTSPTNATNQRFSSSKSNNSLRSNRTRTNSMTSLGGNQRLGSSMHLSPSSSLLPSNSQASLENVIGSRLVETFIVISIPPKNKFSENASQPNPSSTPKSSRSAPASKTSFTPPSIRPAEKSQKHSREASRPSIRSNSRLPPHSAHPNNTSFKSTSRTDTGKTTSLRQITKSPSLGKGKAMTSASVDEGSFRRASPIYFSPIHKPSTNPYFAIDTRAGHDFPSGCSDVGQFMKIEIWGKMSNEGKPHGKATQEKSSNEDHDWRLLDDWDVDLDKLVLPPDDFDAISTQLPSNTLVLTLEPPGRSFYFPSSGLAGVSRAESPAPGYSSDPESEIRKVKQVARQVDSTTIPEQSNGAPLSWKRRHKTAGNGFDPTEPAKTVSWQELFKLVTLQSLISDTRASLNNVIESINELLEKADASPLRRELSDRESRIREWRRNHCVVLDQIAQRKQDLSERCQRLRERQELLASASRAITFNSAANLEIENQRNLLAQLRQRSTLMRTSLISSLSIIYPIEMYSSADLLFTILDVPLPIPVTTNDPAPPLTLPNYEDVTEETVAVALGYVAQVLQLLATYMGKGLVYPVTCIGSRSLIRDGISAMVGPRMFPLFSKGVDTYRFEYGVFLLNKNIETLMAERDLRALDMRHTLPNLKNLLLTLSHDASAKLLPRRNPPSPVPLITESEIPAESLSSSEASSTPKPLHITPLSMSVENTTPPESGANTPTVTHNDQRKGKSAFLGFVPFTDFLRVRYPSQASEKTIRKVNATLPGEMSEDAETSEGERRTIRSIASDITIEV